MSERLKAEKEADEPGRQTDQERIINNLIKIIKILSVNENQKSTLN